MVLGDEKLDTRTPSWVEEVQRDTDPAKKREASHAGPTDQFLLSLAVFGGLRFCFCETVESCTKTAIIFALRHAAKEFQEFRSTNTYGYVEPTQASCRAPLVVR